MTKAKTKALPTHVGKEPAKKLSLLYILEILRHHSDPSHPLSQQKILQILESDYGMILDRKAIKRNLMNLLEAGYPLNYKPWDRKSATAEDGVEKVYGSWYYEHEFASAEIAALTNSLLFSHLPAKQVKTLIGKLEKLQSKHFNNPTTSVENIPNDNWINGDIRDRENREMFYTLELLNEAIATRHKVEFYYLEYGPDKKQYPRTREGHKRPHRYRVSPYAVVATNGKFYLICNTDGHDDVSHYRLDRIHEATILETEPARHKSTVEGFHRGKWTLPKHLAEHVNMFAGKPEICQFRIKPNLMDAVIDAFGKRCRVRDVQEDAILLTVQVNPRALFHWALQFGADIKVLSPRRLVGELREVTERMAENYRLEEPDFYLEEKEE